MSNGLDGAGWLAVLKRFERCAPASVMVRAALEHALPACWVDEVFEVHRERPYARELLFSTVVDPMTLVSLGGAGQGSGLMLANVRQATIKAAVTDTTAPGTLVHTDEYGVWARLNAWGYPPKTVCHGRGEYARDEDGDGFCEVHVDTVAGFWSLLRS